MVMTSYLSMSVSQAILQNNVSNLLYLVRLSFVAVPLKVDLFLNPSHPEHDGAH